LKGLGIKISAYILDRGIKCSINLINFHNADYNQDESIIRDEAEVSAKKLLSEILKEEYSNLTINVKKK
jgi:hypothetical protein